MDAVQLSDLCLYIGGAVIVVGLGVLWWDIKGRGEG